MSAAVDLLTAAAAAAAAAAPMAFMTSVA